MDFKVEHEIKLRDQIFDARFHPKSETSLVAAATITGHVQLITNGQVSSKLKKHHKGSPIRKVRFDESGKLITAAKTIKVHDLVANETLLTLRRNDGKSTTFYSTSSFSNNIISAGDDDGSVFVWDTRTPQEPIFSSQDCEQYISDIDGKYEARRLMVCTSGEGTLTAYDLRTMKMIEPQSELFETGFQCVKLVELNKKVVIGGEDGAIYVFNQNEWAHTSGKFAISSDAQNRGKCSIDCLDVLPDSSVFLVGCSDGRMRSLTLWPHQLQTETIVCKRLPLESLHVNPNESEPQIVISGENYLNILRYEEKSEAESSGDDDEGDSESKSVSSADSEASAKGETTPTEQQSKQAQKKLKTDTEDYLNVFGQ